jgi:limonene 1,2-monooxygenase
MLERFWQKTGGFGCMLMLAHDWANFEATKKSYEMFMRYVLPKFAGRNEAREASLAWIRGHREEFSSAGKAAAMKVVNAYLAEQAAKTKPEAAE